MEEPRRPGRYRRKRYKSLTPVLIAALLLFIAIIVAVCVLLPPFIRQLKEPKPDLPVTPPAAVEEADDPAPQRPDAEIPEPPAETPEPSQEPEVPAGPAASFDPRFTMTVEDLNESAENGVTTWLDPGAPGARLDVQLLSMSAELLLDEELERLAIGILQAYYYNPPRTEDVTVDSFQREEDVCIICLSAPALGSAPAAVARIKLLNIDSDMWFASLLLPDGAQSEALTAAFDSIAHLQ